MRASQQNDVEHGQKRLQRSRRPQVAHLGMVSSWLDWISVQEHGPLPAGTAAIGLDYPVLVETRTILKLMASEGRTTFSQSNRQTKVLSPAIAAHGLKLDNNWVW